MDELRVCVCSVSKGFAVPGKFNALEIPVCHVILEQPQHSARIIINNSEMKCAGGWSNGEWRLMVKQFRPFY